MAPQESQTSLVSDDAEPKPCGKPVITKEMAYKNTAFAWPEAKKWRVIVVIFIVQLSMNFNAAIYGNAISGIKEHFGASDLAVKMGGALFLIFYAFGCELWAPFSEEFGRWGVLQCSLLLVNLWQLPCALAPFAGANGVLMISIARTFGGLSSAGGSVTLGMVADMWEPEEQQYALNFVVLSSVMGSVIAPIAGGFIEEFSDFPWIFWTSLIFGGVAQFLQYFVPETRLSVLLDKEAIRRRGLGMDIYGPGEIRGSLWKRFQETPKATCKEIGVLMWRPYKMLVTEKIVCCLSLLSGFSDMLVFVGLSSYSMVLKKFGFGTVQVGLAFNALLISYILAYAIYMPIFRYQRSAMRQDSAAFKPERRLTALNFLVLGMPLGLVGFAFSSLGPAYGVHWVVPLVFLVLIGIANYAIYGATIDYMVAAYGEEYSASATGGNGFARDFLAGTAMLWATNYYNMTESQGDWAYVWPTLILAVVAFCLCVPVWIFYVKGEKIRQKSPMARAAIEESQHRAVELQNVPAPAANAA